MELVAFALAVVVSAALFAALACGLHARNPLPIGLLWVGSIWTIAAFVVLPWLAPGPPGTLDANVEWLAGQSHRLAPLKQLPALQGLVDAVLAGAPEDLKGFLETRETAVYLQHVLVGRPMHGQTLWQLTWTARPLLASALTAGVTASILGLIAAMVALTGYLRETRWVGLLAGVLALVSLVICFLHVPTLDSLGRADHLQLRLVSVLGAVKVTAGAWWMCFGLLLIACAGAALFFLADTAEPPTRPGDPLVAW